MTLPSSPHSAGPPRRRPVPAQRRPVAVAEGIGGLPLVCLRLGLDGRPEAGAESRLLAELDAAGATDLLAFCHGWNPAGDLASPSARAFFQPVPALLHRYGSPERRVVLLDVQWPGQRWSDEPVPEPTSGRPFARSFDRTGVAPPRPPDEACRQIVRDAFDPARRELVDELLELLVVRPDDSAALKRARVLIRILAETAPDEGDGERREVASLLEIDDPHPDQLFADFLLRLTDLGVVTDEANVRVGFGDSVSRLWHGAQEATRQLTYWQLKRRAAQIGAVGLGPLIGRLHDRRPELGINLIGHGLGAPAVGHALRGLPPAVASRTGTAGFAGPAADASGAAVRSVTLLQGAFSHFAFADKLPFDASRSGALAGLQDRVSGPVVACYSRHDHAVGVFYSLAARGAGPDTAGFEAIGYRWGALGQDGHQPSAREFALNPTGVGYDFARSGLVNIDASWVIGHGTPPCGAHFDILHPELVWISLNAAGLC
jgi:hypothetical protein